MSRRTCEILLMFSSDHILITDFKLLAICPCLVPAFVFHQPLIFQMFFWNQMTFLKNLDLFVEVFVKFCSTFWSSILKPSFVFLNDSLGLLLFIICCSFMMSWRTRDPFVMFSSDHLLITNLKPLVDCPCIVPAVVFHQPLIFQMFFRNQMTFLKNLDLFVEVFFEIIFTFLIIDLENVVCVFKWFVGTPSFHHMLFLFVLANMWDSFVMFSSHYLLITDFKLLAFCPCLVPAFVFHQPLIFQMFDFFEESWLVCWSFCEILFNFLIIDLATVVCVCKWFVGTPSFHHMLFLYDVLANMWDPFVMFSSDHLLITNLKPFVDCPCIVPAFVFHQPLIFQMFFWNQMTFLKNLDLFVEVFFEIIFTFLIIDLATVVCVCKWFVGTPSFHHMLFLYDVLANMWDPFVMFSSNHLLITNLKRLVDCPCFVPAFVFHQPLIFQMFDFFEESWLVCWSFFEILFNFLIIDLEKVVCVCKWFVGTPSFIICCSFLSWRTCETLLWCSLVTTFWQLISNSLLIVHVSFQLLFFINLWYFRCLTFLKNLD